MAKNLDFKVNVDVQDNTEASIARLRELRNEIKNVAADSEDFRRLRTEMDDIEDSLNSARVGAGNFVDILGTVPGPIGEIGSKASDTINTLKGFSKLSLDSIMKSFTDLKDDIVDTFKGLSNLTGVTKVYTVLNNALATSFVKVGVGEAAAATGARIFSAALTATGIGAIVVALGFAISALMEFANAESAATKEVKKLNDEIARGQEAFDARINALQRIQARETAALRAQGKTEQEIRNKQLADKQELEEAAYKQLLVSQNNYNKMSKLLQKEYNDDNKKAWDDSFNALTAARNKYEEAKNATIVQGYSNEEAARAEAEDAAQKAADAAEKRRQDALKRTEDAYNKEIELSRQRNQKIINDQKIAGEDTTQAEINLLKDRIAIMKKYGRDTFDLQEEVRIKEYEAKKSAGEKELALQKEIAEASANTDAEKLELEVKRQTDNYNRLIEEAKGNAEQVAELEKSKLEVIKQLRDDFDADQKSKEEIKRKEAIERANMDLMEKFELNQLQIESDMVSFEEKLARNAENETLLNQMFFESEAQKTRALKENSDQRKAIEQAEFEFKMSKTLAGMELASQAGAFLQQIAGKNKGLAIAGVIVEQAGAIGKIIANTAIANAKAIAVSPLTGGQPFVTINKISAALSIASTIAGAAKAISEINKADASAGAGSASGSGTAQTTPSKFAQGGLLKGPLHATGGISVGLGEAEGGEFIVNRYATASFLPLLESINNTGRGKTVSQNNLSSDAENTMLYNQQQPIIKTYVVASDITSAQEAQKKISDIARL